MFQVIEAIKKCDEADENPLEQLEQEQKIVAEQMEEAILSMLKMNGNGSIPVMQLAAMVKKVGRNRVCF